MISFLNDWVTYNQGSESPIHINAPDISWSITNNPYTITCNNGTVSTAGCSTTTATISSSTEENISKAWGKEIKDFMVKNGLPKEILKLREIDFYDHIVALNKYSSEEIAILKEVRKKLGGRINQKVARVWMYCKPECNKTLKLLKNK